MVPRWPQLMSSAAEPVAKVSAINAEMWGTGAEVNMICEWETGAKVQEINAEKPISTSAMGKGKGV